MGIETERTLEGKLALSLFLTFTNDCANVSKFGWDKAYEMKQEAHALLVEYDKKTVMEHCEL